MSDVNAAIRAVDDGIDMLELYSAELDDRRAYMVFALNSLMARAQLARQQCDDPAKKEQLQQIEASCHRYGEERLAEWSDRCGYCQALVTEGIANMGRYLHKLNSVVRTQIRRGSYARPHRPMTYVCVIDSKRYPQTAEHIRTAINSGQPQILTIDRNGSQQRRKESLEGIKIRPIYDRDEYPMAVFAEGGQNANVVYVEDSDNRGAGAYVSWQLRGLPDGTQVRIRII